MPPAHRAKQFMPFAAVKGLQEALQAKERPYTQQKEIAEDAADTLNAILAGLMPGMQADITYYSGGESHTVSGEILSVDGVKKRIRLEESEICFNDLISINAG